MTTRRRLHPTIVFLVFLLGVALAIPTFASASQAASVPGASAAGVAQAPLPGKARKALRDYARTTYASLVAMTSPVTGLPADRMSSAGVQSAETSTTNIGGFMWSTVVAEKLKIISHAEAVQRLDRTLDSLETMERHWPDGQYYNWYDHNTLQKIAFGGLPRLSSVDNGWLATGLHVVYTSVKEVAARAKAIYDSMDFGVFHRVVYPGGPGADDGSGNRGGATYHDQHLDRILFHIEPSTNNNPCCYDTMVSESRIATYIGIAKGELPDSAYFGQWRTFPDTCDWSWQETKPIGVDRTYEVQGATNGQVTVFEGAYPYENYLTVPGWGGSMFEALMPNLFVPEEKWAPHSWKINHPGTVEAQIHHGLVDAQYGYWGFSPSDFPSEPPRTNGGYDVFGVDAIGLNPEGYPSNEDHTFVDHGFAGCRPGQPDPPPSAYTNGVVTPHAAFLALRYAPKQAIADLANLQAIPNMYGAWGFRDSVNVQTKHPDDSYLSLDQSIVMGAIGNALGHDMLRKAFATHEIEAALKPLMAAEQFGATKPKSKLLK
jgi:Putative glucoamylase/Protein of unknown function (DUF3131)